MFTQPVMMKITPPTALTPREIAAPDFLGRFLSDVVTHSVEHDPFARGWNEAMRFNAKNPDRCHRLPMPVNVIFNNPATIVFWDDGDKTVVKCQPGDTFNAETGLTTAMLKKYMGNDNTFNKVINEWMERVGNPTTLALPEAVK